MKIFVSILAVLACAGAMAQDLTAANETRIRVLRSEGKNAQVYEQGDEPLPAAAHAGYNAPAGIVLKKNYPDLFGNMSFLYYYASQDQMDLATSLRLVGSSNSDTTNGIILSQSFDYKPAFKIGVGGNFCEWQLGGEYTWIRQTTSTKGNPPAPVPASGGIGVWGLSNWFVQGASLDASALALSIASDWNLQLDIGDLTASRPFYEGRKLILSPFFGFRMAWIRQKMEVSAGFTSIGGTPVVNPAESTTRSNSWGVGPRAGFGASGLLGFGFHIEGSGAVSLLYTEYTTVKHKEQLYLSSSVTGPSIHFQQASNTQVVRPELDMSLGFGWGSYLKSQQFHIDFSAAYDFTIFWQQNMMRTLLAEHAGYFPPPTGATPGNLYLQGLRLTGRFDF